MQCIKFVLLPLKVSVQTAWGFQVPMCGSWQVTRRKNVNFCQNSVWRKNMQCTLSFACIFQFMSLYMHKKQKKTWIWTSEAHTNMANMQKYAPPLAFYRHTGPQVTNQGYPGLSQFIWWYPWLTPDIKSYPVFRWTVGVRRGVTRPAPAARQPGEEMNETYCMSTSAEIFQDNSVLNYYPDLPGLYKSGHLIPIYPGIGKSRPWHLIQTHTGLSQSMFPMPGYPWLSWLAQGVPFPDVRSILVQHKPSGYWIFLRLLGWEDGDDDWALILTWQ